LAIVSVKRPANTLIFPSNSHSALAFRMIANV
jgi:hypothetical protein